MLDNILKIVKDIALEAVNNNSEIPNEKKGLVVETATDAITSGFTQNLGGLAGLLSGKSESNSIMDSIQQTVISSLMKKVGLDSGVAGGLVATMLPSVIGALTKNLGNKNDEGFNIESVLGAFAQGDKKSNGLSSALGALGKLFG